MSISGFVHVMGIGGIHMSAIALLLHERGIAVSGCDLQLTELTERLSARGIPVASGHDPAHVEGATLLVRTAAIPEGHPEVAAAAERGVAVKSRAEMVAELMAGKRVAAVAGSHGKTTTSSLLAYLLRSAGRRPMFLLGGESRDLGTHAAWGGPECVVEADEYKNAFLAYQPAVAVVTNVEPDHLDFFASEQAYVEAFAAFIRRIEPGGTLVWCVDDAGAGAAVAAAGRDDLRLEPYGFEASARWRISSFTGDTGGAHFTLETPSGERIECTCRIPGEHVARNAAAAIAAAAAFGVDPKTCVEPLRQFAGAKRRLELLGEREGVRIVDDYAHHPSEVRATLAAARRLFPGARLLGVHQPHTYSRIAYLWDDWLDCWDGLDALVILETYAARERPQLGRGARELAAAIRQPQALYAPDFQTAAHLVWSAARPGDVILTIGAGDVFEVGRRILEGAG
ncbi:MAG: UDP-N-acetylmuramate--L-alanine ligase [Chloroflexota bacterium]|nr:UDP-N-acetylmuramate--L-alanine ligase [Chloroflexota bacterium]